MRKVEKGITGVKVTKKTFIVVQRKCRHDSCAALGHSWNLYQRWDWGRECRKFDSCFGKVEETQPESWAALKTVAGRATQEWAYSTTFTLK